MTAVRPEAGSAFASASAAPLQQAHHAGRCVVCREPLHPVLGRAAAADPYPSCHAIACRMVVARRAGMDDAVFRDYLCRQAQQRQGLAARTRATAERKITEGAENAHAWDALQRLAAPGLAPLQLVLPSGPRRTRKLSPDRRARYRAHLMSLAAEATALAPIGLAAADCDTAVAAARTGSSLPGRLCAQCAGGCCTRGADEAYLSAPVLRRFMDSRPGMDAATVVEAYMARLAHATQAGSCINHGPAGCGLPREMRSDICNRFACAPLARLLTAQQGEVPPQAVLVVRRGQDHWRRADPDLDNGIREAAVLRETSTRRLPARHWRAATLSSSQGKG